MNLILASNSPRRKQLLTEYGFNFTVKPSGYEEKSLNFNPEQTVKAFALGKALDVFNGLSSEDKQTAVVLGADTVVCLNDKILGKPKTEKEALDMLKALSGREHSVLTGYCLITAKETVCQVEKTAVIFNELSNELIEGYVATGKPMDKAGAYGIQDGYDLVKEFKGSYNNVVGLPVEVFKTQLTNLLK
jgi:septum formation protein